MKLEDWMKDPALREAWRSTWNEPHMRLGLDLLRISVCEVSFKCPGSVEAVTAGAMRDAAREGCKANIALIEFMGSNPPDNRTAEPMPAYSLLPEDTGEPALPRPPAAKKKPKNKKN